MKKYLVIGNPIEHSLSPRLHNYWIKKNNIEAVYDKKKINESDIKSLINEIKNEKIKSFLNLITFSNHRVISFLQISFFISWCN